MKPPEPGPPGELEKGETISTTLSEAVREIVKTNPSTYFVATVEELIRRGDKLSMEQVGEISEALKRLVEHALPKVYEVVARGVAKEIEKNFGIKVKIIKPEFNRMRTQRSIILEFPHDFKYSMYQEGEHQRKIKEQQKKFNVISSKFPDIKIVPGYGFGVASLESLYTWWILVPDLSTKT